MSKLSVSVDLQVTSYNEADRMMLYHLQLAAAYFECTRNDHGRSANLLIQKTMNETWGQAASAFIGVLCSKYEEMDK